LAGYFDHKCTDRKANAHGGLDRHGDDYLGWMDKWLYYIQYRGKIYALIITSEIHFFVCPS
jgi:hypothetical protein